MVRPWLACVLSFALVVPPVLSVAAPAPGPPAAVAPADGGWPRSYPTASGGRLTIAQPQIVSWKAQKRMVMYAAVSYMGKDDRTAALGTLRVEANTSVAVPERLVNFSDFVITAANFPTLSREQLTALAGEINAAVPLDERVIGLDRVLAAVDTSEIEPRNNAGVKSDPPAIFYSTTPAVLVNLDGDPIWSPIKEHELRFAMNTNWDLFEYPPSNTYYLRINDAWMKASNVDGPWTLAAKLPDGFAKLPDDDNWKDTREAFPPHAAPATTVFVSKTPAELLLLRGAPIYTAVTGTKLFWISNTDSDVFRVGHDGPIYYLVSGRWFSAPTFKGPWTFATPTLPEDFKRIPLGHPRSRVLASVPGTTQALDAVLLAQIPQTARVSRVDVKAPAVAYSGDPQFEPIDRIGVARAVNTDKQILRVGDQHYMCYDGVWFVSPNPNGPWALADTIPEAIYNIPTSSPAYNATNVRVKSYDDDAVVFEAAAPYAGMMVAWGCAVWGTGWYYPPYVGWGGYYPVYFPRYPSYGYGAWYNPWTGSYTRAGVAYGPYGGAGYGARYNLSTGMYARGAAAWGPGGARGAVEAWKPRPSVSAQTRQGANIFGSWGSTAVQRGDRWAQAQTARGTNRATGGGDVFAGHDGNVYRNQSGSWQKYQNGGWNSVERPSGLSADTKNQLNRDFAARREGAQRTNALGSVRSSGGASRTGSYRPSGGSFSPSLSVSTSRVPAQAWAP